MESQVIASQLVTYSNLCSQLLLFSNYLQLVNSWPQLGIKVFGYMQLCSCSQITAASDWSLLFWHPRCFCLAYHCFFKNIIMDTALLISYIVIIISSSQRDCWGSRVYIVMCCHSIFCISHQVSQASVIQDDLQLQLAIYLMCTSY